MASSNLEKKSWLDRSSHFYDDHEKVIVGVTLGLIAILTLFIEIAVAGIFSEPKSHLVREDIYFVWLAGDQLFNGVNPYDGILSGNLIENDKYATYFPFFYVLSYIYHLLGFTTFHEWVRLIQILSAIFYLAISYLLFFSFRKRSYPFAVFTTIYWIFNRWTIVVIFVVHIDFIALFFMLYSLMYYEKHRDLSLLSFGLSLTMKQMAIFLVPLFIIFINRDPEIQTKKMYLSSLTKLSIIPIGFSLPFMVWNFKSFVYSMLFNVTRIPRDITDEYWEATEAGGWLAFGVVNRLFMLLIMAIIYIIYIQDKIGKYTTSLLIFVIFIEFNIALFDQYRVWRVALLPLAFLEFGLFPVKKSLDDS